MKVMVTGSKGFIGSHLTKTLAKSGHDVSNFDKLIGETMDITSFESVNDYILSKEPEVVLHLAANANPRSAVERPESDLDINTHGTINILKSVASLQNKPYFVFVSTAYVYGENVPSPVSEKQNPNPSSPYGISKLAAESYVRYFSKKENLNYTILRLFNIYGPGQSQGFVVPDLISRISILRGSERLELRGSTEDTRDFLYIEDLMSIFEKLLITKPKNQLYNVGTGVPCSIGNLARNLARLLGRPELDIVSLKNNLDAKPSIFYSDPSEICKALDWSPKMPLERGLQKTADHFVIEHVP